MSESPDQDAAAGGITITWRGMVVRVAGLAFAAYLVSKGWAFWPVVIALVCLGAC